MSKVHETMLPGVGVRHDLQTREDRRVGVIAHHSGRKELLVYERDDPDACAEAIALEEDEGHAVAEMLGGAGVTASLEALAQEIEGLAIDWVRVGGAGQDAERRLAELDGGSERSATVVAVQRGDRLHGAPGGEFKLRPGDVAVVVGTREGVVELAMRLRAPA